MEVYGLRLLFHKTEQRRQKEQELVNIGLRRSVSFFSVEFLLVSRVLCDKHTHTHTPPLGQSFSQCDRKLVVCVVEKAATAVKKTTRNNKLYAIVVRNSYHFERFFFAQIILLRS